MFRILNSQGINNFHDARGHYGDISPRQQPIAVRDFTGSKLCHIIIWINQLRAFVLQPYLLVLYFCNYTYYFFASGDLFRSIVVRDNKFWNTHVCHLRWMQKRNIHCSKRELWSINSKLNRRKCWNCHFNRSDLKTIPKRCEMKTESLAVSCEHKMRYFFVQL